MPAIEEIWVWGRTKGWERVGWGSSSLSNPRTNCAGDGASENEAIASGDQKVFAGFDASHGDKIGVVRLIVATMASASLGSAIVARRAILPNERERNIPVKCHEWYIAEMKFHELVETVADEPLFETGLLLAGAVNPFDVRRQLSRWTRGGQIHQLRRGLYALAPPWQKRTPHSFLVANRLAPGSYVSGLSALAFAQVIPEYVAEVTSVAAGRPRRRYTPFGRFSVRHLRAGLMFGYRRVDLGQDQYAFVAAPEKALLDMIHLQPGGDEAAYLAELRLDYDALRLEVLDAFAATASAPKLIRAAERIRRLARGMGSYEVL